MEKNLYRKVGDGRYRESVGLYYEDFEPGVTVEHRPGRTITQADNVWFTNLTMNPHPLHFDEHFASHTEWKKPLVNSCLTLAIVTGMTRDGTFLVEGGRIVGPVRNLRFTQSYLAALAGTVAVGSERRTIRGDFGGVLVPPVRIDGWTFTGATEH